MAPGRKRGAKGVKTTTELNLGDLVLAKVKGFPAWPAKISRSEDWERAPDPKKYFVQFFGTSEIAFVAPVDIQAFTSETKNKLSARCQGKTLKYFAQAVKEISAEFEVLQHKNLGGVREDNNAKNLASETHTVDPVVKEALDVCGNHGIDNIKPCPSDDANNCLSPNLSLGKRSKLYTNSTNLVNETLLGSSPSCHSFVVKEEAHHDKVEDRHSDGQSELTNGLQPKLVMGSRRMHEGTMRRNSGLAISRENFADGVPTKFSSGGNMKVSPNLGFGLDVRRGKKLMKEKKHFEAVDDGREDSEDVEHKEIISGKKMKFQHDHQKQISRTNKASCAAKVSKFSDIVDAASMLAAQESKKNDSRSPVRLDDNMNEMESKRLTSGGKAETHQALKGQITEESNHSTDEDDFPLKRHRRAHEMLSSASISERLDNSALHKNGLVNPNKNRSPVKQPPTKRRAVRLCDDDDDELPKTPIHGGFTHKVSVIPRVLDSKKKNFMHHENHANDKLVPRNLGRVDNVLKEKVQSSVVPNKASSTTAQQAIEKSTRESSMQHTLSGPPQLDPEKLPFKDAKPVIVSPKGSSGPISATGPIAEPQKQHFNKARGSNSPRKVSSVADRTLFLDQSLSERSSQISEERGKTASKIDCQVNESNPIIGNPDDSTSLGERLDVDKDSKTGFQVNAKVSDSVTSMKHLIAAAQARKRQSYLQNSSGNSVPLLVADADTLGRSPSPTRAVLAVELSNSLQGDAQGIHPASPSSDFHQFSSINEHENRELEERRLSSGHQASGSSLSSGTDAAVARDAFEGMIETLSRTKESIGRATRLAIDCAKYGIANQVVELLIQKLENEPSLHRKVDLFFLVDSITQCSHSQKGIAGAAYIPIVQAALPRLIGAAAPPGQGALENRRQCHKVLRLWIERKILPESLLRRYVDDVGATSDDTSVGYSLRRPSRAERAVDDPIREMDGMLVDEYGSNVMIRLPGFLASHVFEEEEDEDDFPTDSCKEVAETLLSKHMPSWDPESYAATPTDRRHCILEDVDGELEMEDVSGNPKDERPLFSNGSCEIASLELHSNGIFESTSKMSEMLPSPEGSPPLPPGSPPVTPPQPSSLPPLSLPPPPPLPLSPPPPPPPPLPPSPPPPPPPSSSPPPQSPPPSSQQLLFPPPPAGLPPFLSEQSLPPQPALKSQRMPPPPSTMSSSQPLVYHPPPLPLEIGGIRSGNQDANVVSNIHGSHIDAPVRGEAYSQQSSFFPPAAVSNGREHTGYNSSRLVECGQGDAFMTPQVLQHRKPFLPGGAPFAQRPLHLEPPPQRTPNHFSYPNPVQQHQYPPYSLPNFSDGPRRYAEVNTAGFFGPPPERPPINAANFPPSAANSVPSVHGVSMMACKPDIPAVNWRPA